MSDEIDPRVLDLLAELRQRRDEGRPATPRQLCDEFGCPELLADLLRADEEVRDVPSLLGADTDPPGGRTGPYAAGAAGAAGEGPFPAGAAIEARFRVLSRLDGGGQGDVFLARDEVLDCEVVLKAVRPDEPLRAEQERRFRREVEVTSRLNHPGILAVHGAGRMSDGRPCYAMRRVPGRNLREALREFHAGAGRPRRDDPAFRGLLGRFVAACNAVAYAHEQGVVHRDLKPANVMVGEYGESVVIDWGLALVRGRAEPATDEGPGLSIDGQTEAGRVAGTPAYVAPEQARGDGPAIDARTDVFGLGAILYELLTGRPPHQAATAEEAWAAARAGVVTAPRAVNPHVPAAPDAVCRKALAADPAGRYGSAAELAAEVERWLADEPVRAYREPRRARLARWGRRHLTAVVGVLVLLATATAATAVGLAAVLRQRDDTRAALRLTREALQELVGDDATRRLIGKEPTAEEREGYLRRVAALWERLASQPAADEETRAEVAGAHLNMGTTLTDLGELSAAEAAFRKGLAAFEALAADRPHHAPYRREAARCAGKLGDALKRARRLEEAEHAFRDARDRLEALAAQQPDDLDLADLRAHAHTELGDLCLLQGRVDEAGREFELALGLRRRVADARPDSPEHRWPLAQSIGNVGAYHSRSGRHAEAVGHFRQSAEIVRGLLGRFPKNAILLDDLATGEGNLGVSLVNLGRWADAELHLREAVKLRRRLAEEFPGVAKFGTGHLTALTNLATMLKKARRPREAGEAFAEAEAAADDVARRFPNDPETLSQSADLWSNHGLFLKQAGRLDEAERSLVKARDAVRGLAERHPDAVVYRERLGTFQLNLAGVLSQARRDGAEREYRAALAVREELAARFPDRVRYAVDAAAVRVALGEHLPRVSRAEEGLAEVGRAIELLHRAAPDPRASPEVRTALREAHVRRADLLVELRRGREAVGDWDRAVELSDGNARQGHRLVRAEVLARMGETGRAVAEAEAVLAEPGGPDAKLLGVACVFSLASADGNRPAKARETFARRAMELLRRAQGGGYFTTAERIGYARNDKDLNPLRPREDFRRWLAEIGRAAPEPASP
jgi:tetratricopeptide (TPR) repeat protein/tRNA A-37 threonylcarbamoyl transferase component Bud32